MALAPVEEYELDRVSGKLALARVNPTRGFAVKTDVGFTVYWFQNGQYFAGDQECEEGEVPQVFRDQIAKYPLTVDVDRGVKVTEKCKYCKVEMNHSLMAAHVIEHMDDMMKHLGSQEEASRKGKG